MGTIRIGRIFGIDIRLDWSWLLIFLLLSWSLTTQLGMWHPRWGLAMALPVGVVGALLFFASVLVHELAHSVVAILQGLPVRSITLFLFGGISNIEREPPSPRIEFLTAMVGPATSIALGVGLTILVTLATGVSNGEVVEPTRYLATLGPVTSLLLWLGAVNVIIGCFNLIPAFPLDGGRMLRSAIWAATRDLRSSTQASAAIGQVIGWVMILGGVAMSFGVYVPFFGTGLASGLWLAFIGWFLNAAAAQSFRKVILDEALEGVTVASLMRRQVHVFAGDAPLDMVVHDGFMQSDERAFPVMDDGHLVGLVCMEDVRRVQPVAWSATRAREVMTPIDRVVIAAPAESAADALAKLAHLDVGQLPVVQQGALVGMLHRRDVDRWLELHSGHAGPMAHAAR